MTSLKSISQKVLGPAVLCAGLSLSTAAVAQDTPLTLEERQQNSIEMADCVAEEVIAALRDTFATHADAPGFHDRMYEAEIVALVNSTVPCFLEATGLDETDLPVPPLVITELSDRTVAQIEERSRLLDGFISEYVDGDTYGRHLNANLAVIVLN